MRRSIPSRARRSSIFVPLLVVVLLAGKTHGQCPPFWDPTPGTPGLNGTIKAAAVFDDGTGPALYVGGSFTAAGGVAAANIAKWNGSGWSGLGTGVFGSLTFLAPEVRALAAFDDGTGPALYVGGSFISPANGLARWNGSSWSAFAGPSGLGGAISAMTVFDDGTGPALYVGGGSAYPGSFTGFIFRWTGTGWSQLGSGIGPPFTPILINALAGFDDGTGPALHAAGNFGTAGGIPAASIAKWNGTTWAPLGTGLVVPPAPQGSANALASFDDGTGPALYVGGSFTAAGGVPASGLARWSNGSWSSPGGSVGGTCLSCGIFGCAPVSPAVNALRVFDDGAGPALFAGGGFTTAGGVAAQNLARWTAAGWSAVGGGVTSPSCSAVSALLGWNDASGSSLCVAGLFTGVGGLAANSIAQWRRPGPVLTLSPAGFPGGGITIAGSNLVPGHEYYNIGSFQPCGSGPGSGPYLGLCASDPGVLLAQALLPVPSLPFHFIAPGTAVSFGPYPMPSGTVIDGLCIDGTGGMLGCYSAVVRVASP